MPDRPDESSIEGPGGRVDLWNAVVKERYGRKIEPQEEIVSLQGLFQERNVKRVLDLGCGGGRHLLYFAKLGYEVFGIDMSPEAIRLTREWLAEEGLAAELQCRDMKRLPWADNFFDAVFTVQVIEHNRLKEIRGIVSEVDRVLRADGYFFAVLKKYPPRKEWKDGKFALLGHHLYAPIEGTEKGLAHYFFTEEELRETLAGFDVLDIRADKKDENYCVLSQKR